MGGCRVFPHVLSCLAVLGLSSLHYFERSSEFFVGENYVIKEATLSNAVNFRVAGYGVGAHVVFFAVNDEGEFIQQFAGVSLRVVVEE